MKKLAVLSFIFLFALGLRLYALGQIPVSLYWDEAAIGYNAHSILLTGKDEYGERYPLLFRSFNDYKLPGYVYLAAAAEKVFGYGEFAVRFPSALFGALTVIALYILVTELGLFSFGFRLLGVFMLAISPWHLQFSRGGFEASVSFFFIVFGLAMLLAGRRKGWLCLPGFLFLGLSFFFYYAASLLVPVLAVASLWLYRDDYRKNLRWAVGGILLAVLMLLPYLPRLYGITNTRVGQVSIFNDPATAIDYSVALARNPNALWAKLLYNRRIAYIYRFLENYFRNNSLDFLFIRGDPYPRHHVSGVGYLYLWEIPFFLVGIIWFIKQKNKASRLVVIWWLWGAVPASLTTGSPHGLRSLSSLLALILFTIAGLNIAWQKLKTLRRLAIYLLAPVIGIFFIAYLGYYYDFTPRHVAKDWGDGHKQLFSYLKEVSGNYDQIFVTGANFKPYIYALYYLQYDPKTYQAEAGSEDGFSKYRFYRAAWEKEGLTLLSEDLVRLAAGKKALFVFGPDEVQEGWNTIAVVRNSFGQTAFVAQTP